MFTANTELQVSNMQFNAIKSNLKTFIGNKTEFNDYDFEGSTINYLLDILTYNTYMNSFYTNMALNETYLDTAQIRANVVSNAKKLGYIPSSIKAARAKITVKFNPTDNPSQLRIPKGAKFICTKDGIQYNFVTLADYVVTPSLGVYLKTIEIYQGELLEQIFTYNSNKSFYPLLEKTIDISTLAVTVASNISDTNFVFYNSVLNIVDIDPESEVFFIQENSDERYELYFGNDVLGKALLNGNIIRATYLASSGSIGNGLASFKAVGTIAEDLLNSTKKYSVSSITVEERSSGGKEKESIESIRFNAPNSYFSQNRLVTHKDFENYIYANFPYVQSINVWGGEDHWTPIYGKVIVSIKPFDGYALPNATKDEIISKLTTKSMLAIEPLIIDPIFTFVKPTVRVTYDSSKTIKTVDEIFNAVQLEIQKYEDMKLSTFSKSFIYSNFVSSIDSADRSITGNNTSIELEKRFVPVYGSTMTYELQFGAAIRRPYEGYLGSVYSTGFKVVQSANTMFFEDDGFGKIRMYYVLNGQKTIFNANCGTVNYSSGAIKLNSIYFTELSLDSSVELKFYVVPETNDYYQSKNQILLFSEPRILITDSQISQIVKNEIADVEGNISPVLSTSITGTLVTL